MPKPKNGERTWARDYQRELLNFPNAEFDDCVDVTTLALNHLTNIYVPNLDVCAIEEPATFVRPESHYYIG